MSDTPDALTLIRATAAVSQNAYNELMRRDPRQITHEERLGMIEFERQERAQYEIKERKRQDKKEEKEAA